MGAATIVGGLPAEVIQRIVRQYYGRFRLCYENGLRNNPNLQGRVTIRFLIGTDGKLQGPAQVDKRTTLPDNKVNSCIKAAFQQLRFPQPKQGTVRVSYPIILTPAS